MSRWHQRVRGFPAKSKSDCIAGWSLSSLLFDLEINLSARDSVSVSDTMVGAMISTSILLVVVRPTGDVPPSWWAALQSAKLLQSNRQNRSLVRSPFGHRLVIAWSSLGHQHHIVLRFQDPLDQCSQRFVSPCLLLPILIPVVSFAYSSYDVAHA